MPAGSATQEPGAQDNRLILNSNEVGFEPVAELEDGVQYRLTILATQNGAGDFTVEKVESAEPATGDEGESDMGEMGSMGMAKDEYPNPAVAGMMSKKMG